MGNMPGPKYISMKDACVSCFCTEEEFRRAAYILKIRVFNHKYYDFNYVISNSELILRTGEESKVPRGERRKWMVDHWEDTRLSDRDIKAFVGESTFKLYPKLGLPKRDVKVYKDDTLKSRVRYLEEKQEARDRRYYFKWGIERKDYLAQQEQQKNAEKEKDDTKSAE
jgi:hypothetical protein